ncbi:MAG TPA: rhodanese-like domain-containing protein [Candidatus Handelsmanbacteria bacterium]|nr:rhodanese-like domain-containing protein [Candidatus Handelsmanbacteria bacterium]
MDNIQGYLEDGIDSWETNGFELSQLDSIGASDLASRLKESARALFVLDVRTESEWNAGHIEGAHHIHGGLLQSRFNEVPKDRPIAVVCGSGYRGSIASSFLKREGYQDVSNILGGMSAWTAAGLPTA